MSAYGGINMVEDGLVFCLDADIERSYTGGSVFYDVTPNSNDFTMYNCTYIENPVGAINLTYSPLSYMRSQKTWSGMGFNVSSGFTLGLWVSATGYAGAHGGWPFYCESYLAKGFRTRAYSHGGLGFWATQSGGTFTVGSATGVFKFNGSKQLLTYTYQGTTGTIYHNGQYIVSATGTIIDPTTNGLTHSAYINGSAWAAETHKIIGYNRALTAEEITQLYHATKTKYLR